MKITLDFINENFYECDGKVCRKDGRKCSNFIDQKYYKFVFKNKTYKTHRILWILRNQQEIPEGYVIDHIDGNGRNNLKENLRLATYSENNHNIKINKNNRTGIKGIRVIRTNDYQYYMCQIQNNYDKFFKTFPYNSDGLESAKLWLEEMRKVLHKEFANNG